MTSQYIEQLPPHDDAAEEALLGSLLIDGNAVGDVLSIVQAGDFYRQKHSLVYASALRVFTHGDPVNQISVADDLHAHGLLDDVGGLPFLSHVLGMTPTSVYAAHYAAIVLRLSIMRRLLRLGGEIAEIGSKAEGTAADALGAAESLLYRLRVDTDRRSAGTMADVAERFLREVGPTSTKPPLYTGFHGLDRLLGGLRAGQLIVLAARPAMGKSALAHNIIAHVAQAGGRCLLFSAEMPDTEVFGRMLGTETRVSYGRIRDWGGLMEHEQEIVSDGVGRLSELPIVMEDSTSLDTQKLRGLVKRHAINGSIALVVVDYLQLLRGDASRRWQNRAEEVGHISRELKSIALDMGVPVLAVSQLNRAVEGRLGQEPQLSDLRESGSIEQDADIVLFLSRADLHVTEEYWARTEPGRPYPRGIVQVRVAKHRSGPNGMLEMAFQEQFTRFVEGTS